MTESTTTSTGQLRKTAPAAHQRGHLRLRRQHDVRRHLLLDPAAVQSAHRPPTFCPRSTSGAGSSSSSRPPSPCPLGLTQGKEYAELIWPIDIAVALIWVVFAVNFFWTLARRNEPSLYVAIWFYIATIVTVAMLYIVNNLSSRPACSTAIRSSAGSRTRWSSGGTATTPWPSS
jgi:hypothetical protein